ncbi:MAG: chloride channel protein, partial [Clostridia bacterium]|nr:chloride channel protein [Clostridia bacterium]
IKTFVKWSLISIVIGLVGGLVGTLFHKSVDFATDVRTDNSWLIYLLPLGGLLIVYIYNLCNVHSGTNRVIESVRTDKKVPVLMAPLIFVSTVITHLFGGSVGREGAALQLGGSIGYRFGKIFRLDEKDMHLIIMLGMSSVFAALFGTPLTATFFALEVISVGVIYYVALVPCILSSVLSYKIALLFGVTPVKFDNVVMQQLNLFLLFKVVILAILCAVVSICFCLCIKAVSSFAEKKLCNPYYRAFIGGCIIIILTLIVGTNDYNGAGMDVISRAIGGSANPEAFVLKLIFTVITIACGFKGGEIVPTFFIGSTFGCVAGALLGINPSFTAALGFVALFCGVVNCPFASIMLALEVFGAESILIFVIVCGVSYMMSGYYGLYSSQKIMYSKLEAKYININTK